MPPSRIDRTTLIPLGFAVTVLGGLAVIIWNGGRYAERVENRLSNIERQIVSMRDAIHRLEFRPVLYTDPIAYKPAKAEAAQRQPEINPAELAHGTPRLLTGNPR